MFLVTKNKAPGTPKSIEEVGRDLFRTSLTEALVNVSIKDTKLVVSSVHAMMCFYHQNPEMHFWLDSGRTFFYFQDSETHYELLAQVWFSGSFKSYFRMTLVNPIKAVRGLVFNSFWETLSRSGSPSWYAPLWGESVSPLVL